MTKRISSQLKEKEISMLAIKLKNKKNEEQTLPKRTLHTQIQTLSLDIDSNKKEGIYSED